jgi:hypothetical protein
VDTAEDAERGDERRQGGEILASKVDEWEGDAIGAEVVGTDGSHAVGAVDRDRGVLDRIGATTVGQETIMVSRENEEIAVIIGRDPSVDASRRAGE